MKARLLKKLMGEDCGYYPNDNTDYIALGSPLCHNLISVNKKTLEISYALDTFKEGKEGLVKRSSYVDGVSNILKIWNRLEEIIQSGEILDVINGVDEIENPIAIWTINNGELVQTYTDKMEWPNTTYDGKTIYENTYFDSKEKAIEYAIREYSAGVSILERSVERLSKDLQEANDSLEMYRSWVDKFKGMSEK